MNEPTTEAIEKVVDIAANKAGLVICAIFISILYGSWFLYHRYEKTHENSKISDEESEDLLLTWAVINLVMSIIVMMALIYNFYYILYAYFL